MTTDYSWKKQRKLDARARAYLPNYDDSYRDGYSIAESDVDFARGGIDVQWKAREATQVASFEQRAYASFQLHPETRNEAIRGFKNGYRQGIEDAGIDGWQRSAVKVEEVAVG